MRLNQGYSYRHVLGPEASGFTTLAYLSNAFSHSTEQEWRGRLEGGEIELDERPASGAELLEAGSVLIWNRPGWLEEATPQEYGLIYEDEYLLVVNKPSGLPTLPGAGFYLNTLVNLVREDFAEAKPLHRLGRATSGLVMLARNREIAAALHRRWSSVQKQYVALGSLVAVDVHYDIQAPIGELAHPRLGKVFAASASGKPARSVARTLCRRTDSTLFEVDLHTGRAHQIRIHLAYIGHPLVGDPLYAVGGIPKHDHPGLPGDAGYWLHAKRLAFEHPITGQPLVLEAPPPAILHSDSL